jgi:hypothetical protein
MAFYLQAAGISAAALKTYRTDGLGSTIARFVISLKRFSMKKARVLKTLNISSLIDWAKLNIPVRA